MDRNQILQANWVEVEAVEAPETAVSHLSTPDQLAKIPTLPPGWRHKYAVKSRSRLAQWDNAAAIVLADALGSPMRITKVIEMVARVALVEYTPELSSDPVFPVLLTPPESMPVFRHAYGRLFNHYNEFHRYRMNEGKMTRWFEDGRIYIDRLMKAAMHNVNHLEAAYLHHQAQLCFARPNRHLDRTDYV